MSSPQVSSSDEILELRAREEQLGLAIQVGRIGTCDWNLLTGQMIWSAAMEQIHGLEPGTFEGNFEAFSRLIHQDDRQHVRDSIDKCIRQNVSADFQFRVAAPDGDVRWIACRSQALRDEAGKPARWIGIAEDITERKRGDLRLAAQYAITRVLAESVTLQAAAPRILRTICESLDWDAGAIWTIHRESDSLACLDVWHGEADADPSFTAATRSLLFARGVGLPGRVWESGEPVWIPDVASDGNNLPRASVAERNGMHAAIGFPLHLGAEVVGVVDFFSRQIRQPDPELLEMFSSIGSQIGQAIERMRARDRIVTLQSVTSDLSQAVTSHQVAEVIVTQVIAAMGAKVGTVYVLSEDGSTLRNLCFVGYPEEAAKKLREIPAGVALPVPDAVRRRELIALSTLKEQYAHYPLLAGVAEHQDEALAAVPMLWKDRAIGAIGLTFTESRLLDAEDRALMLSIAQQCAQALERARLYEAEFSARAAAEQNLRALAVSEARMRTLIESNVIGVMFGEGEIVTGANQRLLDTLGYTYEDLLAGKLRGAEINAPEFRQANERATEELRARGSYTPFEKEYVRKDGSRVPVLIGGAAIQLNPTLHWISFVLDLTERRRLEQQLLRSQKLESLGVLAAGIAHDFNNLLTGVLGNSSLALELAPRGPMRAMLEDVVRASQQASNLTRQMLAYVGRGRFVVESIDLSKLVRDAYALVKAAIPAHVTVKIKAPEPALIVGDAAQIQQLVMNLVLNAAESIAPDKRGAVLVTVGIEAVGADIEMAPGVYAVLRVQDNGCGMDRTTEAKIFDPFFSTKFTGRGLGLAAVSGMVRTHKGAIQVKTSPGEGSTFSVFLPALSEISAPARSHQGNGTILVVEDEPVVRQTAKKTLEHFGYKPLLAKNGPEAIEIFRKNPDKILLVLLDLSMPAVSGDKVYEMLKAIRPGTPIIISSGYTESEVGALFPEPVKAFLQKPYTASQLVEKIKSLLDPNS